MIQAKPKCSICRRKTDVHQVGLKHVCTKGECRDELVRRSLSAGRKKLDAKKREKEKQEKREREKRKFELLPMATLCSRVQNNVNRYIRAVDIMLGHSCISCAFGPVEEAGHYHHAGSKWRISRFRFSHIIIHGQCTHCNGFSGGGNHASYTDGLIRRYGRPYVEAIEELKAKAERGELKPIERDEVLEINKWHLAQTKVIKEHIAAGTVQTSPAPRLFDQWGCLNV